MVLELKHTLLPELEAIKCVMVEKHNKNLKAKNKASTARPKAKSNPKRKASGGPTGWVPNKSHSEKFCQHFKAHGGTYQTHNTLDCCCYDSNGRPLETGSGKPSKSKKPYKKFRGNKGMAFMQPMFEAYMKSQKKAGKSKKCKRHNNDSNDCSTKPWST